MKVLGVITARGGSKRVKRKNVRGLNNKPLLLYTIEAAQKSRFFNRLILSSEDEEIIGMANGVEVQIRPDELATDESTSLEVIQYVVAHIDFVPDIVVILEPTSPFRTADDIDMMISIHIGTDVGSVYSVNMGLFSVTLDTLLKGSLYGNDYIEIPSDLIDINTEEDFERAEKYARDCYELCLKR